jgi:hypothetical protein
MCKQSVLKALSKLLGRSIAGWEGLRCLGWVLSSYRVLSGAAFCSCCAGRGIPLSPECTPSSLRRFLSTLLLQPFSGFVYPAAAGQNLANAVRPLRTCAGFLWLLLVFVRSSAGALLLSGLPMRSGVIMGRMFRQYGYQSSLVVPPVFHKRPPSAQCTSNIAGRCSEHLGAACS